jgi:uncharacterized membrane protein
MHYNLNERQKPKKRFPWKKVIIICLVILAAIAIYIVVFHTNTVNTPVKPRQPT